MEERENRQGQPGTYGEESPVYEKMGGNGQNGYGQPQPGNQNGYGQQYGNYPNPYYGPNPYFSQEPVHGPVTDVFCNLLLVIMPLRILIGFFSMYQTFSHMRYQNLFGGHHAGVSGGIGSSFAMLAGYGLMIAFIVFVIIDIVKIHQQNYKITGLILFAIFLTPGYYIWRAYVLGRKKTFPIIYTVVYSLLLLAYLIYTFYLVFQLMMGILYFY